MVSFFKKKSRFTHIDNGSLNTCICNIFITAVFLQSIFLRFRYILIHVIICYFCKCYNIYLEIAFSADIQCMWHYHYCYILFYNPTVSEIIFKSGARFTKHLKLKIFVSSIQTVWKHLKPKIFVSSIQTVWKHLKPKIFVSSIQTVWNLRKS